MSANEKFAWFTLGVVVLTLVVVGALYPFLGPRAAGGFGLLGFWGFSPLLFRKRPGQVLADERDGVIQARSVIVAYSVVWVALVAAVVLSGLAYGEDGAIPVVVVHLGLVIGAILLLSVMAVASLLQYARERGDVS